MAVCPLCLRDPDIVPDAIPLYALPLLDPTGLTDLERMTYHLARTHSIAQVATLLLSIISNEKIEGSLKQNLSSWDFVLMAAKAVLRFQVVR